MRKLVVAGVPPANTWKLQPARLPLQLDSVLAELASQEEVAGTARCAVRTSQRDVPSIRRLAVSPTVEIRVSAWA
jgi:hypothetical protein